MLTLGGAVYCLDLPMTVQKRIPSRDVALAAADQTALSASRSDRELLADVAVGREHALRMLYDRHASRVLALAYRILGEHADAEEVVLDTFAQVWRQAASYDVARGSVRAWVSTIARSRALDGVRASNRRVRTQSNAAQASPETPPAMGRAEPTPDRDVEGGDRRKHVAAALADLPADQRKAIELAYYGGLSQSEIADHLDAPLGTVKTRIRSAMMKLRDTLRPLYGDPSS